MKKMLCPLLLAALLVPACLSADKTILRFLDEPLGQRPLSHDGDALRGTYRYEQSTHARGIGGYCGPLGKSAFWLGGNVDGANSFPSDVPLGNLLVQKTDFAVNVALDPVKRVHGIDLERVAVPLGSGWSLTTGVRLLAIQHWLRPSFAGSGEVADVLRRYLVGVYEKAPDGLASDLQEPLLYQRFFEGSLSATGADSWAVSLGKRLSLLTGADVRLQVGMVLPLHRREVLTYVFQPFLPTQTPHAWLGAEAWSTRDLSAGSQLQVGLIGRVGYQLPFHQVRTFATYAKPFGPYRLLGFEGLDRARNQLVPAANILTVPALVKPGLQVLAEARAELEIYGRFVGGARYAVQAAAAERVRPRRQPLAGVRYAYAAPNAMAPAGAFQAMGRNFDTGRAGDWLRPDDVDLSSAGGPAIIDQVIGLHVGYQAGRGDGKACLARLGVAYHHGQSFLAQNRFQFVAELTLVY